MVVVVVVVVVVSSGCCSEPAMVFLGVVNLDKARVERGCLTGRPAPVGRRRLPCQGLAAVRVHRAFLGGRGRAGEVGGRDDAGGRRRQRARVGRGLLGLAPGRVDLLAQVCGHGVCGRHGEAWAAFRGVVGGCKCCWLCCWLQGCVCLSRAMQRCSDAVTRQT